MFVVVVGGSRGGRGGGLLSDALQLLWLTAGTGSEGVGLREEKSFSLYAAFLRLTFSSTSPNSSRPPLSFFFLFRSCFHSLASLSLSSSSASLRPFISIYMRNHRIIILLQDICSGLFFFFFFVAPFLALFTSSEAERLGYPGALRQRRYIAKQMLTQLCHWHDVIECLLMLY